MGVAELEVRPGAIGSLVGQEVTDRVETIRLMGELGTRDLDPTIGVASHSTPLLPARELSPYRGTAPRPQTDCPESHTE